MCQLIIMSSISRERVWQPQYHIRVAEIAWNGQRTLHISSPKHPPPRFFFIAQHCLYYSKTDFHSKGNVYVARANAFFSSSFTWKSPLWNFTENRNYWICTIERTHYSGNLNLAFPCFCRSIDSVLFSDRLTLVI